jgi:hypothetical protein
MIATDHQNGRVTVNVYGEFTLADYRELEEQVNYTAKFEGPVDLLLNLSEMAGFTLDVAWEEVKFARQHTGDFRRIAVVSGNQWVGWTAWLNRSFVEAEIAVFDSVDDATAWLADVDEV